MNSTAMAGDIHSSLSSVVDEPTLAATGKVAGMEMAIGPCVKKGKHKVKLAFHESLAYEGSNHWEEWMCVGADIYLDVFAMVAVLSTSGEARKLKQWRKKAKEAADMFNEANSFLQRALQEDTMVVPGFGGEDGPLIGEVLPLKDGSQSVSRNLYHLYTKYLLQNPKFPATESYTRWCRRHTISREGSVSLSAAMVLLNPHLSPDAGFDKLQVLLGAGIPKIAAPTELQCMNPYVPWESQAVPCHPPVLTMNFNHNGITGVVCIRGSPRSSGDVQVAW